MRKLRKLFKTPPIFIRDYLNKRYPIIRNEILCPQEEERILIHHDMIMEEKAPADFPIDVVFTWVDDQDPNWIENYNSHCSQSPNNTGLYAKDPARFSNHNELKYSLNCVLKYIPWVRNVFIVTDNQRPAWLDDNYDIRVKVIHHHDIIPECYLPTFNSHVIEAHLHNINDLAEHFIYFNDDVFIARPLPTGHFFRSNGISSLFVSLKSLCNMKEKGLLTPTLNASLFSSQLLKRDFGGELIDSPLVHTYVPLRKSLYKECYSLYEGEITRFLHNKFRANQDLNLATFLVPWFSYLKGSAVFTRDICYYFNIRSPAGIDNFNALSLAKKNGSMPHSFCANDFHTTENSHTKNHIKKNNKQITSIIQTFFESGNGNA
ncbi:MAG: stealth family protein [Plesiomonas sp.]